MVSKGVFDIRGKVLITDLFFIDNQLGTILYWWKTRGTFGCSWSPEGGKVDRANDDLTMEISEDSSIINVM